MKLFAKHYECLRILNKFIHFLFMKSNYINIFFYLKISNLLIFLIFNSCTT